MTAYTMKTELREEIRQLYHYDGPAHPEWSAQAVKVALGNLRTFIGAGWESDEHESYSLVSWAFNEGMFPELSKLVVVTIEGAKWRDGVPETLRDEMSKFARSLFKVKHVHPAIRNR